MNFIKVWRFHNFWPGIELNTLTTLTGKSNLFLKSSHYNRFSALLFSSDQIRCVYPPECSNISWDLICLENLEE